MAYECQNFKNGQILTAECLNKIDEWLNYICGKEVVSGEVTENGELVLTLCNGEKMNIGEISSINISGQPGQVLGFDADGNPAPMLLLEDVTDGETQETVIGNLVDSAIGWTSGYGQLAGPIDLDTLEIPFDTAVQTSAKNFTYNKAIKLKGNTTYAFSKGYTIYSSLMHGSVGSRSSYIAASSFTEGDNCLLYTTATNATGYYLLLSVYKPDGSADGLEDFVIVEGTRIETQTVTKSAGKLSKAILVDNEQLLTNWKDKKWCVVGDSITAETSSIVKYYDIAKEQYGMNVVVEAVGGSGYYATTNAIYNRIGNVPADADVITIFAGINDVAGIATGAITLGEYTDDTVSTFCGCVNRALDILFENNVDANVGIITPLNTISTTGTYPKETQNEVFEALKAICEYRSIPMLDLYHGSGMRPDEEAFRNKYYSSDDGLHPNTYGHSRIYPKICEFVKTLLSIR